MCSIPFIKTKSFKINLAWGCVVNESYLNALVVDPFTLSVPNQLG
ncbi:hypothetical protein SAMN04487891_11124 [Flagellimonas taeanensis]|uniref:Uncharacterized protein n=1 Tax=Flagellimonas taeanensis TaxID=1005926 RepID=A0A1M6WGB8_9FLAO|nr:hypothetical protein SAMN04487891_11124 [Allomuricauda taeanensis]SHK92654.1 hypothetical protein SAMN05216293_2287 [Allomuricauda taeanensis]